ncbi:hypothetical protein D515_04813 [Grimontia indica]|uniref:OmpA-like domain-containing protein n=1 Tax=Grimontia indica TaxID=1056512 RepID=R1GXP9_9GAMM|nr:hypothetical protein [Grimontia indica]EOD80834.1 hypothetical protein D515_04813 [Grimontia indica]
MTDTLTNSSSLITGSTNQSPVAPLGQSLVTPKEAAPPNLGTSKFKFHLLDMEYSSGLLTFSVLLANFAVRQHKLLPGQKKYLDELVSLFKAYGDAARVTHLIGRASKTGPEGKNKTYAKKRLESVKQYLVGRCPNLQILKESSDGSSSPTHVKNEASQLDWNRSVEIRVSVLIPEPKLPKPKKRKVPIIKDVCSQGSSHKWRLEVSIMLSFDVIIGVVLLVGKLHRLSGDDMPLETKDVYVVGATANIPLPIKHLKHIKMLKHIKEVRKIVPLLTKPKKLASYLKHSKLGVSTSVTSSGGKLEFVTGNRFHCYRFDDFEGSVGMAFASVGFIAGGGDLLTMKLPSNFPQSADYWFKIGGIGAVRGGYDFLNVGAGIGAGYLFVE